MRAITVRPGHPGSLEVREVEDPAPGPDELLVDGVAVGVCDRPITRRLPLERCAEAYAPRPDDIKVTIALDTHGPSA